MPTRSRPTDEARRRWDRLIREIGDELRTGRRINGATQAQLGRSIRVSQSEISRRERGRAPGFTGAQLATHAAAVGLRMSIKLWPVGGGIRDAAQARYIGEFVRRIGRRWRVILEAPIQQPGDLRAVDVLLVAAPVKVAVEVITRLSDLQAQIRAGQLKSRDIGATRLILGIAGTHANRRVLNAARLTLVSSFDLDSRRIMAELAAGRDPGRDGIVLL